MFKSFTHGFAFVIGAAVGVVAIKMIMDNQAIIKAAGEMAGDAMFSGPTGSGAEWEVL